MEYSKEIVKTSKDSLGVSPEYLVDCLVEAVVNPSCCINKAYIRRIAENTIEGIVYDLIGIGTDWEPSDLVDSFYRNLTKKLGLPVWENFWGDDAEYDICEDCELVYEKATGKSCVLWTPDLEKFETPTDDLASRPKNGEYSTHGFTCEFESWGIEKCNEAINNGCKTTDEVFEYICKNPIVK